MDFTKFMQLIEKQSLFFPRADKFDDKFEGSYPENNIRTRGEGLRQIITEEKPHLINELPKMIEEFRAGSTKANEKFREWVFISCWHINEFESAAMWKLYSESNSSIAVQSTIKRLKNSFRNTSDELYIGKVKYIDYDSCTIETEGNAISPFVYKRLSFKHENELRVINIVFPPISYEHGVHVNTDINELIEKIYISPTSPQWFSELLNDILKRYHLQKEIIHSDLTKSPMF